MEKVRVSGDLEINCERYDFTDPWKKSDTIVLAHGNCSNLKQWLCLDSSTFQGV